jgi:hypothetical protein
MGQKIEPRDLIYLGNSIETVHSTFFSRAPTAKQCLTLNDKNDDVTAISARSNSTNETSPGSNLE